VVIAVATTIAAMVVPTVGAAATPVTKAQYAAMLKRETARIGRVERAAQLGLVRKASPAEMKRLILAWAATTKDVGESFQRIRPPADAASANGLLARGEVTYARELARAASRLPQKASAVGSYLARALADSTGAKTVIQALTKLRLTGYY
jgi:hypothetical protein